MFVSVSGHEERNIQEKRYMPIDKQVGCLV
jgi:hypothetical protein